MTSRMFLILHLFVLSCLFLTVTSQTGKILPPQDLTLQWIDAFQPNLSWSPPQHQGRNCTYKMSIDTQEGNSIKSSRNTCSWQGFVVMNGGFLKSSVITVCNGTRSEPAVHVFSDPELVKNFKCYVYAPQKTHCGWVPASHTSDLRFYYRLIEESGSDEDDSELQECSLYNYTDGVRTGCEVKATDDHVIYVFFHGTLNNRLVRNTFKRALLYNVRPPPLEWTVTKTEDKFNISWTQPDISKLLEWTFQINYTECNVPKTMAIKQNTSYQLDRNPDCRYCIAIKADERFGGETPWSRAKCFDKDSDALVYMTFIIPLAVAALAALTFICCRKNIKKICPKIIKPADYISDIVNNNKSIVWNFPIPVEEEQTCEITVMNPQVYKSDC